MVIPWSLRKIAFTAVVLALGVLISIPAFAQVVGATLSGTVTDLSGAVITKADISIKDVATGIVRATTTDSAGFYSVPNLVPGTYEITVSAAGFQSFVRSGMTLTVGAQQVLNFPMQVGSTAQHVQVTGEAPAVELSSSSVSNGVGGTTIRELPLNGRDWTQLAILQPGVVSLASLQPTVAATIRRAARGTETQLTVSGARPQQNNYRVDGISVNDYANNGPGDAIGTATGVDAIREFSVLTGNYPAEYGRTSGGVINAITRSGTNDLHGSAYDFLRNSAFDARNYFDGPQIPEFRRNQFGASVGGPIIKDRTFFFFDYEGLRQLLGTTARANVPSVDARNGIIHNANGTTTTLKVDPKVAPFLAIYPLPNAGLNAPGNTGIYSFVKQQVANGNFETFRIDHHFSDKDIFSGTYSLNNSDLALPDALNSVLGQLSTTNELAALEETHVFNPQLINTLRFGFTKVHDPAGAGVSAINPAAADLTLGAVPGYDAPRVLVSGLTTFAAGLNDQSHHVFFFQTFQGYDDANLTVGKHNVKFGASVERDQDDPVNFVSNTGGQFQFGSLNALLLNQPRSFSTLTPVSFHYRDTIFGAYFQDDIRWRPNLTINLGMRYEMSRVPTESNNRLANLYHLTDVTEHVGNPLWNNPTLWNFEPRVGFAWDPFGDGKTSIRSAFGIYDSLPLLYLFEDHAENFPFNTGSSTSNSAALVGTFPQGALAVAAATPLQAEEFAGNNLKRNYLMQWNLSLQREIATGLTVTATYIGAHGVHDPFNGDDANMVIPTLTSAGWLWPNPATKPTPVNPAWGQIGILQWNNSSLYHALETQVTKRLSAGFQIQGSYTWGKSIDSGSGTGFADPFSNSLNSLPFFESNRSVSDYNVKQNLVINGLWMMPSWGSGMAKRALGGWGLGGIFQASTGLPFTPLIGGDPLGRLDTAPLDFPSRLTGAGCGTAVNPGNIQYINVNCFGLPMATPAIASQCVPFTSATVAGTCRNLQGNVQRNSLIGPGLLNLDMSVVKNNYFGHSERFNAQLRAEFFNVLNHTNFTAPVDNSTLFDQTGTPVGGAGRIDTTSTSSREIQFALKLIW